MEAYKYNAIVDWAKAYIAEKGLCSNDRFLSENELCAIHNVSRQTVRQALAKLENDGIICRVRGSGTFVAEVVHTTSPQNKTVGVISTYFSDYIFPSIVTGIEGVLKENGYSMQLSITHNKIYEEAAAIRTMLAQGVAGLIVEPSKSAMSNSRKELFNEIRERNIPLVFFNAKYPWADFPCVAMNDEAAGKRVTDYLFEQGHKHIAGIFALDDNQGHDRYYGYMNSCAEHGIFSESSVLWYSTEERDELFTLSEKRIMKLIDGVTAVVCYNDKLAVDLLKFCREKKISVPDELSVVGIDDSKLATLCDVGLTTVKHPQQRLGEAAAEKLLTMINNPKAEFEDVNFMPELVIRNSVSCIK